MQDIWQGRWNQVKGKIKQQWGKLTDDDLAQSQGNLDYLVGKIQEQYGGNKEEIRRQLENLMQ